MDLKWQVAMISMRMKKFYKKTRRKLQFDAKEPVGFDKTKVECFNCHNTWHFARECRSKGNQESRRRDAGNTGYKAKDNGRRPRKQEEPNSGILVALILLENKKKLLNANQGLDLPKRKRNLLMVNKGQALQKQKSYYSIRDFIVLLKLVIMKSLVKKKQKLNSRAKQKTYEEISKLPSNTPLIRRILINKYGVLSSDTVPELHNSVFCLVSCIEAHTTDCLCSFLGKPFDEEGAMAIPDLNGTHNHPRLPHLYLTEQNSVKHAKIGLSAKLIMKLRDNAYDGTNDAVNHITRFLQTIDLVKTPNVNIEQLCVLAFQYSLTGKAQQWWMHEENFKITSWVEIVDKLFYKYYPLSRASKSNNTSDKECHSKFMNWLSLKFKNPWKLSSATKNALWNFWEKGYDNDTLDYDEESSDDECSNGDNHPFFDHR
ncbi:ribonuclease H-like domain-containing protein [Tanacetum coccineum]